MKRVCSGCGIITDKRRCASCQRTHEAARTRRSKGHYDATWQKNRDRAIREHPWCVDCGTPGSPDNPLTGDHIVAWVRGGPSTRSNIAVRCRRCNASKGARN